jgi:DNA invertase Pin-like site-specific DNA recombinase
MGYRKKKKQIQLQPGWAIYLRTSDEEAQNPESSQERQRFIIQRAVLDRSDLPVVAEYVDVLTGKTPFRTSYQRMLDDARMGCFSHVVVERADRFGRNDAEALRAIDELDEIGIAVRFANHPDLDPIDPDDRVVVALSFTLARRESLLSGLRIKGACEAKRSKGGYLGRVPNGFISVEDDAPGRKSYMKKGHHIEQDPETAHIWRLAWDYLLEDKLTLAEICEELHARGFRYRSGRPFVQVKATGKRKANYNTMSDIFHNWTYAGWIVNEDEGILPKTLRGDWEPIVSTEEFERGLAILARRNKNKIAKRKHDYLLKGLIFLTAHPKDPTQPGDKLYKLTGSTSNPGRSGGGTAHYRLEKRPVHFLCHEVESQLADHLRHVQIDADLLQPIREHYISEVADKLGRLRPDERTEIERALKQINEEEARVLRLYASGLVTEENWKNLWAEWQDKRQRLQANLDLLDQKCETYINDLDDALTLIAKLGVLYGKLSRSDQKELLRNVVERVVVNPEGKIARVDLLPPFAYLQDVSGKVGGGEGTSESTPIKQTSDPVVACSRQVFDCGQNRALASCSMKKTRRPCYPPRPYLQVRIINRLHGEYPIMLKATVEPIWLLLKTAPSLHSADGSTLDRPCQQTANEVAPQNDEDQKRRQRRHNCTRHRQIPSDRFAAGQLCKADRDRLCVGCGHRHAEQEFIPDLRKLPDNHYHKARHGQWENDMLINAVETRAVDGRCFQQFVGNIDVEVAEDQRRDRQAVHRVNHDQAGNAAI